mmetsp:Transcript_6280/g.10361  ORF Transcript_6280/g.10361 Transcript_6280/m.10361 type:complete len:185 (-) Transcript_6280:149-703(-)
MSMRKLKWHEEKLLKKVNFGYWQQDDNLQEWQTVQRYRITREEYWRYKRLASSCYKMVEEIKKLEQNDEYRVKTTQELLNKLYDMALIQEKKNLNSMQKLSVSAFCRRRLPVVMVRLNMADNLKEAISLVQAGHVRVGTECVSDPAFLVSRSIEDFVSWCDNSKIKAHVQKFNEALDDYDLLGI